MEGTDGLVSSSSFLGKLTATRTLDSRGYESSRRVANGNTVLSSFSETYDGATGNLLSSGRYLRNPQTYVYDDQDRLVSVKVGDYVILDKIDYAPNGNILFKQGVGNYSYDENVRPHAVTEVENVKGDIPGEALNTTFNDLGKRGYGQKPLDGFCLWA